MDVGTAAELPLYTVRPRRDRRGFDLEGPLLPFGLWFRSGADAYSHAVNQKAPHSGARIEVYDPDNVLFKTVVVPRETGGWLNPPKTVVKKETP